jgi:hypothetical protein
MTARYHPKERIPMIPMVFASIEKGRQDIEINAEVIVKSGQLLINNKWSVTHCTH